MPLCSASLRWKRYIRKRLAPCFITGGLFIAAGFTVYLRFHDLVGVASFKSQDGGRQKFKLFRKALVNNSSSFFNLSQAHLEHTARLQHIQKVCHGQDRDMFDTFGLSSDKWAYSRIEIDREGNYLYCPLLKAGSTFFRRVFYALKEFHSVRNPFTIPIEKALGANRNVLEDILPFTSPSTTAFLHNSTAILFVRDPFSRLLSGYVDKLFAPNPYFWSVIGKHIIANFRSTKTSKSLRCGHDVTFEEFVRYVVNGETTNSSHRDAHFTPGYDQCKPCYLNYTILGKMETFEADVAYTLAQLGQNISKEELSAWAKNSTVDAIMDSTVSPFRWKTAIRKCMTWHEALVRVWMKLQIRGIILFEQTFPWSPEYTEKFVTLQIFTDMVKKLHLKAEKDKFRHRKIAVLAEAYSNIPADDLHKLVSVFYFDFQLFQYNPYPSYIFDKNDARQFYKRHGIFHVNSVSEASRMMPRGWPGKNKS